LWSSTVLYILFLDDFSLLTVVHNPTGTMPSAWLLSINFVKDLLNLLGTVEFYILDWFETQKESFGHRESMRQ
jgi:hypothetical protein